MANGIIEASRYNLVPQIPESNAFAQGMRAIAQGRAIDRQKDEMRQAGVLMQILQSGDNAGQMIGQFAQREGAKDFKNELMQLQDIYQQDPQTALGIAESSLRGSEFGASMLESERQRQARMQQAASERGFAPEWVQTESGEQQLMGTKFVPRTGEYSVQFIDTSATPIPYQQQLYQARQRGAEMGKGEGQAATAGERAETAAAEERAVQSERRTQSEIGEAYKGARAINSQVAKLNKAINALERGARVGPVQKMLPAFDEATAQFREASKELGIDVINNATFGALSEKELGLVLETGMPPNLGEEDMLSYLIDKRNALQKAQGELVKMGRYLDSGGTLSQWYERQGVGRQQGQQSMQNASDEDLLRMYGGQ